MLTRYFLHVSLPTKYFFLLKDGRVAITIARIGVLIYRLLLLPTTNFI